MAPSSLASQFQRCRDRGLQQGIVRSHALRDQIVSVTEMIATCSHDNAAAIGGPAPTDDRRRSTYQEGN